MSRRLDLGFVAAGKRSRTLMEHLYTIRDRDYRESDRPDGWPDSFFDTYADDPPSWVEDLSDFQPSVTAIMNPGDEARERAAELCGNHGDDPRLYGTLDSFLDDGAYDAVVVASPNDAHVDAVVPLLEQGTDILCEKPLANTLAAHDRAIEAEADSNAMLYVGFQRRVAPFYRRIHALIDDGTIGKLGMMSHLETRDPFQLPGGPGGGGFRYSQERSGGALLEKNSHDFDLFNWYSGSDPLRVTAFGGQHVLSRGTEIVDQAVVNVEYEGGLLASLELCLYNGVGRQDVYGVSGRTTSEFRGSEGVIQLPTEPGTIEVLRRNARDRLTSADEGVHGGDIFQVHRFLRCLTDGASPPLTVHDAKKAAAIAIGAERSLRNDGEVVEIDSNYDLVR